MKTIGQSIMKHRTEVVSDLKIGGKRYPLDRYLKGKLDDEMGIPEAERKVRSDLDMNLVFDEVLEGTEGLYRDRLLAMDEAARRSVKARAKIFKQRRSI